MTLGVASISTEAEIWDASLNNYWLTLLSVITTYTTTELNNYWLWQKNALVLIKLINIDKPKEKGKLLAKQYAFWSSCYNCYNDLNMCLLQCFLQFVGIVAEWIVCRRFPYLQFVVSKRQINSILVRYSKHVDNYFIAMVASHCNKSNRRTFRFLTESILLRCINGDEHYHSQGFTLHHVLISFSAAANV